MSRRLSARRDEDRAAKVFPARWVLPYVGCVVSAEVARVLAEVVVITVEAERGDDLLELDPKVEVGALELWVLPRAFE